MTQIPNPNKHMQIVSEIPIPSSGIFSFMLPLPVGQSPDTGVTVDGKAVEVRRITDRVLRVLGSGEPGFAAVAVGSAPPLSDYYAAGIEWEVEGSVHHVRAGTRKEVLTHGGLRLSLFLDWFDGVVTGTLEIANADWVEGKHPGPLDVPEVLLRSDGREFAMTHGNEGRLNPREHITRRFVFCNDAMLEHHESISRGEHLLHCRGAWSYETIGAWGPQEITVSDLDAVPVLIGLSSRMIGGESPLRAIGFPGGNETGGFLIEYSFRPGLAGAELGKLLELSDAMMERETIWTYKDGEPLDAEAAAAAYGGTIPFRVEATNVPWLMIPCYYEGKEGDARYPGNWAPGHLPKVNHGWKAHDGQHMVRMTAMLKSAAWNCGDQYALHCIAQVAAHASMARSHAPHADAGWGDRTNTLYEMLNRAEGRGQNLGLGVGKREDAWTGEAILLHDRLSPGSYAERWLSDCAEVIRGNILPTGVGNQKGNQIVEKRAMGLTAGDGPKAEAAPGHEMIVPGMGLIQTFEAEHFAHFMYCMSVIPGYEWIGRYVVECSKLIGGAHVPMGDAGRKGPYWYLNIANEDGSPVNPIFATTGYPHSPFENWYGMGLHAYAALIAPEGVHFDLLHDLYGGGDVAWDLPGDYTNNHLDRAQVMWMSFEPPTDPGVDPGPEPDIDWEARYKRDIVRAKKIIREQQRTIEALTALQP